MNKNNGVTRKYTGPELCSYSARSVVQMLKDKEISPAEALDAAVQRILQVEPAINAMPTLCEERARQSLSSLAQSATKNENHAGWLAGLPIGIKDLTTVSGV